MASYHTSFSYNGVNSLKDKCLIIESFDPDNGFTDSFLSMDNISDDYFDGTKRFDYGSKYNTQANIQITLIKRDGTDINVNEFRSYAKWLTGARVNSWLDMYVGDTIVYSFLGKFVNLEHYKMDARTIGIRLTFSSVSPWAYSTEQHFDYSIQQVLFVEDDGALNKKTDDSLLLSVDKDGILYNDSTYQNDYFDMLDSGVVYIDDTIIIQTDNKTDDLYTYINLDVNYINKNGGYVSIKNITTGEETIISGMSVNEKILLSAKQFIISDIQGKIFGNDFNFVWPRLVPGVNEFLIDASGEGNISFSYRYPMKIGDCAMDVSVYGGGIDCCDGDNIASYDTVRWEDIVGAPTTIGGYGITDVYTTSEVDDKIANIDVEWNDVSNTPTTIEGYGITDAYTTSDVYTKIEVDDKINDIEISGGGSSGGSINIDEEELNSMLDDILG